MDKKDNQQNQTQESQESQQPQQITIAELMKRAINCIDLASSRGAYRGGELVFVGNTYNNLNKYYENLKAQEEVKQENSNIVN